MQQERVCQVEMM